MKQDTRQHRPIDNGTQRLHYGPMKWLNEPSFWQETKDGLSMKTSPKTDFWRITHDGGVRDNGHLYYENVSGDCSVSLFIEGEFTDLYDQAGLMLRVDESCWLKCGIELFEGIPHRSVVVTRDFSDWSIAPQAATRLWIRAKRRGGTVEISLSDDGTAYSIVRQAYLTDTPAIQVGMMAASPVGNGFEARFADFRLE